MDPECPARLAGAIQAFEEELRKHANDDSAVFGMGVACELTGKPDQALKYYRQALMVRGADKDDLAVYTAAKERLSRHIGRIMQPLPPAANSAARAQPPSGAAPMPPPKPAPGLPPPAVGTTPPPVVPPPPTVEESTIEHR